MATTNADSNTRRARRKSKYGSFSSTAHSLLFVVGVALVLTSELQSPVRTLELTVNTFISREHEQPAMSTAAPVQHVPPGQSSGIIVLGMHRSGTSMLTGLLVEGMGYHAGGPLLGANFGNEKGHFELIDGFAQNDEFMSLQQIDWSFNVSRYDAAEALAAIDSGEATFVYGERALAFMNNASSVPWVQKDPRMCITLQTWLPLLHKKPAVLWTYRHPMKVARSLIARSLIDREPTRSLSHVLWLWIVYTIRGLQNSEGLCRVFTNNDAILADPFRVVQQISDDLTTKCGVPKSPHNLTQEDVDKFVDVSLQHHTMSRVNLTMIAKHGDCEVHDLVTKTNKTDPAYRLEMELYMIAMKLYCDMGSEAAYKYGYQWPEVEHLQFEMDLNRTAVEFDPSTVQSFG